MDFPKVLASLSREFASRGVDFAVAGGLAIHILGVQRTTADIDVMAFLTDSDKIDEVMRTLGYETLQRSEQFANYNSPDWEKGRVDILFAKRKYSSAMLRRAQSHTIFGFTVKVLQPSDLVGLKLQAIENDAERAPQDLADIHHLMRLYGKSMDWELMKEYFELFDRGAEFDQLKKRYQ